MRLSIVFNITNCDILLNSQGNCPLNSFKCSLILCYAIVLKNHCQFWIIHAINVWHMQKDQLVQDLWLYVWKLSLWNLMFGTSLKVGIICNMHFYVSCGQTHRMVENSNKNRWNHKNKTQTSVKGIDCSVDILWNCLYMLQYSSLPDSYKTQLHVLYIITHFTAALWHSETLGAVWLNGPHELTYTDTCSNNFCRVKWSHFDIVSWTFFTISCTLIPGSFVPPL